MAWPYLGSCCCACPASFACADTDAGTRKSLSSKKPSLSLSNPSLLWLPLVLVLEAPQVLLALLLEVLPEVLVALQDPAVLEVLDRPLLERRPLLRRLRLRKQPLLPPLPPVPRLRLSPPRQKPAKTTPALCVALQRKGALVSAYVSMDSPRRTTQPPLIRSTAPLNCALEARSLTLAPCVAASATAAMSLSRRPTHLSL